MPLPKVCTAAFQHLQRLKTSEEKNMEGDGVAYMVMGEGGEAGQATQVVAVDNGDGTQQLVSTRAIRFDNNLNKDMKRAV